MIKTLPILKILAVAMAVLAIFSCNSESITEENLPEKKIFIPEILKGKTEIEFFVKSTETEVNRLSIQKQQLTSEYKSLSSESNRKNVLMADIKKVTINGRINNAFTKLSEIYNEIDLQSSAFESNLNDEQKKALRVITGELKKKIENTMIEYKLIEKKQKSGKIIFY